VCSAEGSSIKQGHVKLIDYNSAVFFDEPTEPGGTPEYPPPPCSQPFPL